MPVARIITRSPADSLQLREELSRLGYEVEVVPPGLDLAPVELEISAERCSLEEALRTLHNQDCDVLAAPGALDGLASHAALDLDQNYDQSAGIELPPAESRISRLLQSFRAAQLHRREAQAARRLAAQRSREEARREAEELAAERRQQLEVQAARERQRALEQREQMERRRQAELEQQAAHAAREREISAAQWAEAERQQRLREMQRAEEARKALLLAAEAQAARDAAQRELQQAVHQEQAPHQEKEEAPAHRSPRPNLVPIAPPDAAERVPAERHPRVVHPRFGASRRRDWQMAIVGAAAATFLLLFAFGLGGRMPAGDSGSISTVEQQLPFGATTIHPRQHGVTLAPSPMQLRPGSRAPLSSNPLVRLPLTVPQQTVAARVPAQKIVYDEEDDGPEVVVRHFPQRKPSAPARTTASVKRYSDME